MNDEKSKDNAEVFKLVTGGPISNEDFAETLWLAADKVSELDDQVVSILVVAAKRNGNPFVLKRGNGWTELFGAMGIAQARLTAGFIAATEDE